MDEVMVFFVFPFICLTAGFLLGLVWEKKPKYFETDIHVKFDGETWPRIKEIVAEEISKQLGAT